MSNHQTTILISHPPLRPVSNPHPNSGRKQLQGTAVTSPTEVEDQRSRGSTTKKFATRTMRHKPSHQPSEYVRPWPSISARGPYAAIQKPSANTSDGNRYYTTMNPANSHSSSMRFRGNTSQGTPISICSEGTSSSAPAPITTDWSPEGSEQEWRPSATDSRLDSCPVSDAPSVNDRNENTLSSRRG